MMDTWLGNMVLILSMLAICAVCFWLGLQWAAHCYEQDDGMEFLKWHRERDYKWTVDKPAKRGKHKSEELKHARPYYRP